MTVQERLKTEKGRKKLWGKLQRLDQRCTAMEQLTPVIWWWITFVYAIGLLLCFTYLIAWEAENLYIIPFLGPVASFLTRLCPWGSPSFMLLFIVLGSLLPTVAGHLMWALLYILWPKKKAEPFPKDAHACTQLTKMAKTCGSVEKRFHALPRGDEFVTFWECYTASGRPRGVHIVSMLMGTVTIVATVVMALLVGPEEGAVAEVILLSILTALLFAVFFLLGQVLFRFAFPRTVYDKLSYLRRDITQVKAILDVKRREDDDAEYFRKGMDALLSGDYAQAEKTFNRIRTRILDEAYDAAELVVKVHTDHLTGDLEQVKAQLKQYAARGKNDALAERCREAIKLLQPKIERWHQREAAEAALRAEKAKEYALEGMELYQEDLEQSAIEKLTKAIEYGSGDAVVPYVEAKLRNEFYRDRNNKQLLQQLRDARARGFSDLYQERWGISASRLKKLADELELTLQEDLREQERAKNTVVMGAEDYARIAARADAIYHRQFGSGTIDRTGYEDLDALEKSMRESYGPDWSKDV